MGGFSGATQYGRFDGDIDFWRNGLGEQAQVRLVSHERRVNFRLFSEKDFTFFREAITDKLQSVKWPESAAEEDDDVDEKEEG